MKWTQELLAFELYDITLSLLNFYNESSLSFSDYSFAYVKATYEECFFKLL